MNWKVCWLPLIVGALSGCTYGYTNLGFGKYDQASAISGQGGIYKVGNPYQVKGKWYYPKEDYSYSEVGVASWYGEDFHAKRTANGEKYDMNALTAAHRTLPLPSIVKVTNLQNGRSLVLRVNDRGPYASNRILDVSKRAAGLLGFQTQGTTKVRVEVLEKESKALKAALLNGTPASSSAYAGAVEATPKTAIKSEVEVAESYPKGSYFVQIGSYKESERARAAADKYANAKIYYADVSGEKYYRVRMGPYANRLEAEENAAKVRYRGAGGAKVVAD
ncbi:MAG: septal ring lytic transglycosylase RlpA family protein [Alphaproteobacteria bacterium]|nr:septal ring lytic transglycosylase RlpA family protein [Alphaproteobacteria bacterium]